MKRNFFHVYLREDKSNLILEAEKKMCNIEQHYWIKVALELQKEDSYLFLRNYTQGIIF